MRLENKKTDEGDEQRVEEEDPVEPPLPPHLLIGGGGDGWGGGGDGPSSKAEIISALGEGVGTADGWSWDVEHVSWAEHEGAHYEPGFEPWAEQWAAGPGC